MSKKIIMSECYPCYLIRNEKKISKEIQIKKEKISRKNKKLVKKFYKYVGFWQYSCLGFNFCLCKFPEIYGKIKNKKKLLNVYKKNKKAVKAIKKYWEEEEIYLNENFLLSWYWEDDNGLYSYDGLMPFIYDENKKDDTWSYSETINLIDFFKLDKDKIKNDFDLLENIQKNINNNNNYLNNLWR